jgi:hypothetical protein
MGGLAPSLGIMLSTLDLKIKQLDIKKHTIRQVPCRNCRNPGTSQDSGTPISLLSPIFSEIQWGARLHYLRSVLGWPDQWLSGLRLRPEGG